MPGRPTQSRREHALGWRISDNVDQQQAYHDPFLTAALLLPHFHELTSYDVVIRKKSPCVAKSDPVAAVVGSR